jgi:hypothetical protein
MVVNATFNNISVIYRGGQFYWWRKPEYQEKTTDLSQVTIVLISIHQYHSWNEGRRGRDRMAVGFTTTCAISAYHH